MKGITTLAQITSGTFIGNTTDALLLRYSLETGSQGKSCDLVAPQCPYSEDELLQATEDLGITKDNDEVKKRWKRQVRDYDYNYYNQRQVGYRDSPYAPQYPQRQRIRQRPRPQNPHRRQSVLGRMPPIFRPRDAGAREVCRTCDVRGNVCSVYGIGSFIGCTGILLIGGVPAQVACNVVTTPGSIGCGFNTLHCFMESCGLVRVQLP